MRNKFIYLALTCLLCACHKDAGAPDTTANTYFHNSVMDYTPEDQTLQVLTYNIQLGFRANQSPWDKNQTGASPKQIHDLAAIIRSVSPNIVLLQEVPKNRCNAEIKNFIEALADSLDMNFAFGQHGPNNPCEPYEEGIWGNAILTKFPINAIENVMVFYENTWSTRSVLRAELQITKGRAIHVYNTHQSTGHVKDEMVNTAAFIKKSQLPVIAGGDFNRIYGDPELGLLELEDAFGSRIKGIDRIYYSADMHFRDLGNISGSNVVSDHIACYAQLGFDQ